MRTETIACLVDGARGAYVPQTFVELYDAAAWGITPEDVDILRAGPDHADYWETWDSVLQSAGYTSDDGRIYSLYQDGDLFVIAYDAMTDDEYREFFGDSVLTRWVDVDTTAPK